MNIKGKAAVITGAGSGIGQAIAIELAERGVGAVGLVDRSDGVINVARLINDRMDRPVAEAMIGDVTDTAFRQKVFDLMCSKYGAPAVCVPAAGITRDSLAVKMDKQTGRATIYPIENFRLVMEVNLVAPVYWAIEMMARIAEERLRKGKGRWVADEGIQGTVIFIGSISSSGIPGQVSYSSTKAALEGAAATLSKEAGYHGVRCRRHSPGLHRHPDGPGARAGVHREEHPPLHAAQAVDRSLRNCGCDLLHDLQLGGQRRALGRRWLAPIRLSERDECRGAFRRPTMKIFQAPVPGAPRARSNPVETTA